MTAVAALALSATLAGGANAATLGENLTAAVAKSRDAEVGKKTPADAAQMAVEGTVQSILAPSGASVEDATTAITETRTALGCLALTVPAANHPASCPIWTSAALDRILRQIAGVQAPAATGGPNGPTSIPPPPAFGAGGGGGAAGYRTN